MLGYRGHKGGNEESVLHGAGDWDGDLRGIYGSTRCIFRDFLAISSFSCPFSFSNAYFSRQKEAAV